MIPFVDSGAGPSADLGHEQGAVVLGGCAAGELVDGLDHGADDLRRVEVAAAEDRIEPMHAELDAGVALYSPPDDAGYFINIGAQRLRERGRWPYGDPLLSGTPAAAYGPVLYLAHIPFQLALAPHQVNPDSPPRPPIESGDVYFVPPIGATKLCTAAFHLLAVAALFAAGRRLAGSAKSRQFIPDRRRSSLIGCRLLAAAKRRGVVQHALLLFRR